MSTLTEHGTRNDAVIDVIIEDLLFVHILTHRKLFKVELESVNRDISRQHVVVMRMLREADTLPVSEVGRRLSISRPQMTRLVAQLISMGLVERLPDASDRRVVKLRLTGEGGKTLEACRKLVRDNIKGRLSSLKDDELAELSSCLRKLRDIGSKLG